MEDADGAELSSESNLAPGNNNALLINIIDYSVFYFCQNGNEVVFTRDLCEPRVYTVLALLPPRKSCSIDSIISRKTPHIMFLLFMSNKDQNSIRNGLSAHNPAFSANRLRYFFIWSTRGKSLTVVWGVPFTKGRS